MTNLADTICAYALETGRAPSTIGRLATAPKPGAQGDGKFYERISGGGDYGRKIERRVLDWIDQDRKNRAAISRQSPTAEFPEAEEAA